jgi:HlyD family secretion protein
VADVLQKTTYAAPYDGVITNLPVREGESVVIGIQNALGSTLLTLADMSVITAEVKVDETDIVNVRLGQPADVTIDAIPKHKVFHGTVSAKLADDAIVRSTGVATSQQSTSTSEEAKDFKVVVTADRSASGFASQASRPPPRSRPQRPQAACSPSPSRRSPSAPRPNSRRKGAPPEKLRASRRAAHPAETASKDKNRDQKEEVQGVFVIRNKKAEFVPVDTGISGTTDIEVTKGLQEGDEVITGSYKVLRTLKPGTTVKIDNSAPKKEDESS